MKVLTIGTDITIFKRDSEARRRIEAYGRLFDGLHIVIYSGRGFKAETLSSGAHLYPTNSRWFFMRPLDAVRIGKRVMPEEGIDVISVQDPAESGLAGWLLKRKTGLPLQIQIHSDFFSPHFRRNSWKESLRYWLARFIVRKADALRVVSERIKQPLSAIRSPLSAVTVLPIFVDREEIISARPVFNLHEKYPQFDFVILMVSRLMREKNIGLAIEAFAELLKEFPKTGLVIVGDGPEQEKLKVKSEKLKIAASVKFEGWQEDLISYYKTADLYLLTSNFEGYGRTVIEAAAAGLPIVMTDVGVAGEIIRSNETGRVVPIKDRNALLAALIEARNNYADMRRMANQAQTDVLAMEPKTWEKYLKLYRKSFELPPTCHPEGAKRPKDL